MIKKHYLILLALTIPLITNAQEVVATSGGSMTNDSVQASWTIGETITETISNNKTIVTSGFNQPILKIESIIEHVKSKINISVFPNPTSLFIYINCNGQLPIKAKVLSINGLVLSITDIKEQTTQLDFSNYVDGVYIIEIINKTGKSNMYRIVKQ